MRGRELGAVGVAGGVRGVAVVARQGRRVVARRARARRRAAVHAGNKTFVAVADRWRHQFFLTRLRKFRRAFNVHNFRSMTTLQT